MNPFPKDEIDLRKDWYLSLLIYPIEKCEDGKSKLNKKLKRTKILRKINNASYRTSSGD